MPFVAPSLLSPGYRSEVRPSEWVAILYALGLCFVWPLFQARIPRGYLYAAGHAAVPACVLLFVGARSRFGRFFAMGAIETPFLTLLAKGAWIGGTENALERPV